MRDIRSRISQRHGLDLSNEQIQELAARRLDAILDPRAIKPALLDELRRGASAQPAPQPSGEEPGASFQFDENALYQSHRGFLRVMRRLLKPLLMLFFNPNPLVRALSAQSRINAEAAARDADRDRRQAEWNALHYEILQRLVTEVSRVGVDVQSLSMRVESLGAKVDFNERRVRGLEGSLPTTRSSAPAEPANPVNGMDATGGEPLSDQVGEGARRRRRRRRGRRSGAPGSDVGIATARPGPTGQHDHGNPTVEASGPEDLEDPGEQQATHPDSPSPRPVTATESREEPRVAADIPDQPAPEPRDE